MWKFIARREGSKGIEILKVYGNIGSVLIRANMQVIWINERLDNTRTREGSFNDI